jgi:site-specific recombinase
MSPYRMTVLVPGAPLGVLYLAFAGVYLYGSYLSAGWAKRRYATVPSRHIAKHRRPVTA